MDRRLPSNGEAPVLPANNAQHRNAEDRGSLKPASESRSFARRGKLPTRERHDLQTIEPPAAEARKVLPWNAETLFNRLFMRGGLTMSNPSRAEPSAPEEVQWNGASKVRQPPGFVHLPGALAPLGCMGNLFETQQSHLL